MTDFRRVQGDVNDTIVPTLNGIQDLTTLTAVEAHIWQTGITPITLTAALASAVARTITVQLGGLTGWLSTATPGQWKIEYQLTFNDGTILTWPASTADTITVRAQGA